jgi:SCF-associated factor 1
MLVMDSAVVPKTTFKRTKITSRQSQEDKNLGEEVGMVTNYIILEHFVVFVTDMGKVFAARIEDDLETKDIMELYRLRNDPSTPSDVQGSFRHFAVFKNGGEVIITDQDYLERCWDVRFDNPTQIDIQGLQRVPALQNNDVISVAFGDYHYHALHSNGRITSYGDEPQGCGTLGLGTQAREDFAVIRGMKMTGFQNEGHLLPQTYTTGRQVWFEKEKLAWMEFMAAGGYDPAESQERMALARNDLAVRGEVSEWFEQQSRDWDKRPELTKYDEDGLGAYFALSVSAAGWHSGALVLVNASLVEQLHESCSMKNSKARTALPAASTEANDEAASSNPDDSGPSGPFSGLGASITRWLGHAGRQFLGLPSADRIPRTNPRDEVAYIWGADSFPRLRLSDGRELPGTIPISTWEGPELKSDFHI